MDSEVVEIVGLFDPGACALCANQWASLDPIGNHDSLRPCLG